MTKVMNLRIEKLSSLLDSNETHLNGQISIKHENAINENNPCSSTIKVNPLSMPISNKLKFYSPYKENICETKNSTELNIHKRIHSEQKRFACAHCKKTFAQKSNL